MLWTFAISKLSRKKIVEMFHEKELQRTSQTEFRFEKVIERKGDRLYTKWKSYDNSNNSWNLIKEIVQDQSILF